MSRPVANIDQAEAWDGPTGDHWTDQEERYEAVSARHSERLYDAVEAQPGEAALDVGCGTGGSTRRIAATVAPAPVLGVDLSARMLQRARERARAAGLDNVRFEQADAQVHQFESQRFDLVLSRFGSMFFQDPVAAFANIGGALRAGARIVLMTWGRLEANEWIAVARAALAAGRELPGPPPGTPGMFGLADPDLIEDRLHQAGFREIAVERVEEPVNLGADADEAVAFLRGTGFARSILEDLDEAARAAALDGLREELALRAASDGVMLGATTLITRARWGG